MTSEALTGNRVSSVRYELIKTSTREVYGWVEQEPIESSVSEDFEDTSFAVTINLSGSGSTPHWDRASDQVHAGSWSYKSHTNTGVHNAVVTVPDDATDVTFWYRVAGPTPDADGLAVLVDAATVLATTQNTGGWVQATYDVTGASTVTFRGSQVGNTIGIWIDDVSFDIETPVDPIWTLLDTVQEEASANDLDGVTGGSVDFVANASIKGGGSITIVDNGQEIDWLNDRIKIYYTVEGHGETPLGVFLFSEAPESWSATGRTYAVKLLDKNSILDQDAVDEYTLVDSGTVATTQVATYLTGENQALTPSAATLAGPQVWEPGTSYLRIINDLLATIGYFSMTPNGDGQFVVKPYVLPANRPIIWQFLDGENCIYIPDFTNDVDLFSIPNTFIAVGQGDGETAALVSTYTNTDADSPYSTVSRGRTIVAVETGIEAADQTTLDNYAQRRLVELTSPTQSIEIQHAYVPGLAVNDAVWFRSQPADIDARHVVTKTVVNLDPTALCTTTLQKVVDL